MKIVSEFKGKVSLYPTRDETIINNRHITARMSWIRRFLYKTYFCFDG